MPAKPKVRKAEEFIKSPFQNRNMFVAAHVDRNSGVIHRTIRGRNFIVDANEWQDVTDDPRVLELFSTHGQSKLLHKEGKLVTKPKIKIHHDVPEFEVIDGKAIIHFKVDGSFKHLPDTIKVRINSKLMDVKPNSKIELKSDVPNRLTVKIEDDRVFVQDRPISVMAVPKAKKNG